MIHPPNRRPTLAAALLAALGFVLTLPAAPARAQDLASFEKRVTVHVLPNGWTFLLLERPGAPVFSFSTVADVGSAQEVPGITGLAHMFEHMAFKGTTTYGTTDAVAEAKALEATEAAYQAYQSARMALRPDAAKVEKLLGEFRARQQEAASYVIKNEFSDIIEREGGVGLNAFTSSDETAYYYSLPANKIELWAYLESERFLHPVFREFYEERDVVQEERRLSVDSQPSGRLFEQFGAAAFVAHPYKQPVVGYMSDLQSFTLTDARRFFDEHYGPGNLTTAVVGAIDTKALIAILDKYFGRIPARPNPQPLRTVEPPQIAERLVVLEDRAQPSYIEAYHKPAVTHPDQAVYDALDDVLTGGRTSRLYRSLVRDQKIAVNVASFSGFPGVKYPNLWAVLVTPAVGATNAQVEAAVAAELARVKSEDVSAEEIARFRRRSRAGLLRQLANNSGLAYQLAENQRLFGDWRELFHYVERQQKVTAADVRRVANEAFQRENRNVGRIETVPSPAQPAAKETRP